ncbi:MAG: recombinase family protein [Candidatus Paceibacterota bacterium]
MEHKNKKLKYFIYARRSIEKRDNEERVASVESQLFEIKELAEGLKIVETFTETKSAAEPGRPVFNEMIRQIEAGKANGIICWKTDRLSRNPIDEGRIKYLLQKGIIQNIKATDRDWYPEDNGLLASVDFSMSAEYSRVLSRHVIRGLKDRVRSGFRPCMAPLGYLNSKYREKGMEEILVDPERFPKVRKLFDLMLTGQYSVPQLLKVAEKDLHLLTRETSKWKSKPMGKTNLYAILTNSFYYGEFKYPKSSEDWFVGNHKPMITKEEYDKIQFLLGRKGLPRPKNHIFAFTGLMRCAGCGARITCEEKWKHQRNGNTHHYVYYRCTGSKTPDCTEKSVEIKILEKQIDDFLSKLQIPPEFHEWAVGELKLLHEKEKGDRNSLLATHRKHYEECVMKLDKFAEMLVAEKISHEMYKVKETELLEKKRSLKGLLDGDDKRIDDWLVRLESTLTFAERAREEFQNGDIARRRQILTALGTEHILKDGQIYIQTEEPLIVLQKMADENNKIQETLEPSKRIGNKKHINDLYSKSLLMCPRQESNLQ